MASFARHVDVEWNGNLMEGNGTAKAGTGAFTQSVTFPSRINERGDGKTTPEELLAGAHAVCYAMSLPVATTVSGIDSMKVLRQNLKIAVGFKPMSERQMNVLRRRVQEQAADGRFELYKTSAKMEGPVGRKQHGFPDEEELSA